jgi:hypothetical protein
MENKSIHNNTRDPIEEIFERLEAQVIDINYNMNLLTEALAGNLKPFRDDRSSNSKIKSEDKSGEII